MNDEAAELWTGLFLTLDEVAGILAAIRAYDGPAFLCPMACFAAHTGARRSEMLRSRRADIDLEAWVAVIREKQRVQGGSTTQRVALSPFLERPARSAMTPSGDRLGGAGLRG